MCLGGDIGTCDGKVTSDGVCFSGGAGEAQQPASLQVKFHVPFVHSPAKRSILFVLLL